MRATDGLQTIITGSPVNVIDQTLSLELSLAMSLPIPHQVKTLPHQIEAYVHQAGLDLPHGLFHILLKKSTPQRDMHHRPGTEDAGVRGRGGRPGLRGRAGVRPAGRTGPFPEARISPRAPTR